MNLANELEGPLPSFADTSSSATIGNGYSSFNFQIP